ncbi:MAG TPA: WS/DGAT domain-containing protein, partial [Acidimicrobiales bacterium]|nr:WS/DGAT domain-containing protein [Acidimicrobiales bacterium]
PVLVGRSLDRWLSVTERPMAALRRAARASGGTVNDVLLAAVAGGVYSYHRAQGEPVASVHVSMPVSVRRPGDPPGGNRFAPTHFTLPIDDPDPCARVKIAGAIVRSVRSEPAIGSTELLATGLDVLPRGVAAWLLGGVLRANDVNVVDVPGLDHRAYFAGARLDRLWGLAPTSGAALSVTLLSHERTACIGIMCDRLAVTDPPLMEQCLHDGLDEVIALGRAADRPPEPAPA